jgi:putative IMPACT (imprinted ancient) family translation regulator
VDAGGPESFRTLSHEGRSEFTENKSRFIGYAAPALEERGALAFVESVRAKHPDASAVLYAYICGYSGNAQRFHDSHEPSGGLMMLEALKRQDVTGAVVAVARWFGGVKLGAGPLGRAFGRAAAEAVANAQPCTAERTFIYAVPLPYAQSGGLERWFAQSPFDLRELRYGESVTAEADVKAAEAEAFLRAVADLTGGRAVPEKLSEYYRKW